MVSQKDDKYLPEKCFLQCQLTLNSLYLKMSLWNLPVCIENLYSGLIKIDYHFNNQSWFYHNNLPTSTKTFSTEISELQRFKTVTLTIHIYNIKPMQVVRMFNLQELKNIQTYGSPSRRWHQGSQDPRHSGICRGCKVLLHTGSGCQPHTSSQPRQNHHRSH